RPFRADETAGGAHDQIDVGAGRARLVQRLDHPDVGEVIDLEYDPAARVRLPPDELRDPRAERGRGHQQPAVGALLAVPGEEVEQVGGIGGDVLVGCEQPDVLVQTGGGRVVVAGPNVRVSPQSSFLLTHHQRHFRVSLHPDDAVHNVHTGVL